MTEAVISGGITVAVTLGAMYLFDYLFFKRD